MLFIFILLFIFIFYFIICYTDNKHNKHIRTYLIKKLFPNYKFLTEGGTQIVYINNNRVIKIYKQEDLNSVKLLRKLDIYPPIYKIIKNGIYYLVEEKYIKSVPNSSTIDKYNDSIFKKFKIAFVDNKKKNYGIEPNTNKIYRLDCQKTDIFFLKNTFDYLRFILSNIRRFLPLLLITSFPIYYFLKVLLF